MSTETELYWIKELNSAPEQPFFLGDNQKDRSFDTIVFIPESIIQRIDKEFIKNTAETRLLFFLTTFRILIHYYAQIDEVIISTPHPKVNDKTQKNGVLFLRTQIQPDEKIVDIIRKESQIVRKSLPFGSYDINDLKDKLVINDVNLNDVFNVIISSSEVNPLTSDMENLYNMYVTVDVENLSIHFKSFVSNDVHKVVLQNFAKNFISLLEQITDDRTRKVSMISIINKDENRQIKHFEISENTFRLQHDVVALFRNTVNKYPDRIALEYFDTLISYRFLDDISNIVASELMQISELSKGSIIAVCMENSEWATFFTLGILKAGMVFLSIDISLPLDRKINILEDADVQVLFTTDSVSIELSQAWNGEILYPSNFTNRERVECILPSIKLADSAFVIYTSGSTGKPKGILQTHQCLVNVVLNEVHFCGFEKKLRTLQYSSLAFDVYIAHEMFYSFLSEGTLCIISDDVKRNLVLLADFLIEKQIERCLLPISIINVLGHTEELFLLNKALKHLISAGEQFTISDELLKLFQRNPRLNIHNFYGPSETHTPTFYSIAAKALRNNKLPIGTPAINTEINILTKARSKSPIGIVGEIYIGGANLGIGYLNEAEMTFNKFMSMNNNDVFYKSGDLARWLPDGNIEYVGRDDRQIKIRGQRIELSEIETVFLRHHYVRHAVVICLGEGDRKYLVAYLSVKDSKLNDIKAYLERQLPHYMIPAHYVLLDKMPLNQNGKVEKSKLPNPNIVDVNHKDILPKTEIDRGIQDIWKKCLEIIDVPINATFVSLGGNSLDAIKVVSELYKLYDVKLSVKEFFEHSTIEQLSTLISEKATNLDVDLLPIEEQDHYALSDGQKGIYVAHQIDDTKRSYILNNLYEIKGDLDMEALENALNELVLRHEILRTTIIHVNNEPRQRILDKVDFKIACRDITAVDCLSSDKVMQVIRKESQRSANLNGEQLIQSRIYHIAKQHYIFVLSVHHIICDGWSLNVVFSELLNAYKRYENPTHITSSLRGLTIQYKDYCNWSFKKRNSQKLMNQKKYWTNQLVHSPSYFRISNDYINTEGATEGKYTTIKFSSGFSDSVSKLAEKNGATVFMVLLSSVAILLCRYGNQKDIVLGCPMADRLHPELENQVGYYVKMLPVRIVTDETLTYQEYLRNIRTMLLDAFNNSDYPLDQLLSDINKSSGHDRKLFNVAITTEEIKTDFEELNPLVVSSLSGINDTSKFDLTFDFVSTDSGIELHLEYISSMLGSEIVDRIGNHLEEIIMQVEKKDIITLGEIDYLSNVEKQGINDKFNAETFNPVFTNINKEILKIVEEIPQKIALVSDNLSLTYDKINQLSDAIARSLKNKYGVSRGDRVAIYGKRSEKIVMAMLAILKIDAYFLTIDSDNTFERIDFLLSDCDCKILLVDAQDLPAFFTRSDFEIVHLDDLKKQALTQRSDDKSIFSSSNDQFCIFYTSGSTGKPKSIIIEQRGVVNLAKNSPVIKNISDLRFSHLSSISFDAILLEIWIPLLNGGQINIISKQTLFDVKALKTLIARYQINTMFYTTSMFNTFVDTDIHVFKGLSTVLFGGEACSVRHANKFVEEYPMIDLFNLYGPTENTTVSTYYKIDKQHQEQIPIGKPYKNTAVSIIDSFGNLCPAGIEGEICVSGFNMACGYLNDVSTTARSFNFDAKLNKKIYRTGDRGFWKEDGFIYYSGRKDAQIKLRGYRISLEEIEHTIKLLDYINAAAILHDADSDRIVAYVCVNYAVESHQVKRDLRRKLPEYMVPSQIILVDSIPLSSQGKLDRRKLPKSLGNHSQTSDYEVRSLLSQSLVSTVVDVLQNDQIAISDNFFEVGGDSLKAIQLIARIQNKFKKTVGIEEIFNNPVIKDLSLLLATKSIDNDFAIKPIEEQDYYKVSHAQKRLWIVDKIIDEKWLYNIPIAYRFSKQVDVDVLRQALFLVLKKHEVLRTVYPEVNDIPVQKIMDISDDVFFEKSFQVIESRSEQIDDFLEQFSKQLFDLANGPLLKLVILPKLKIMAFNIHHINADGISLDLILKELIKAYQLVIKNGKQANIDNLDIQYKEYSAWQNYFLNSEDIIPIKSYWLNLFEKPFKGLNFPHKFKRAIKASTRGSKIKRLISENTRKQLLLLANQNGTSLYLVLISALYLLFAKITGSRDLVIGIPMSTRDHLQLENQLGQYLNNIPLRIFVNQNYSFDQFLREVTSMALNAYHNCIYPYDRMISELNLIRERGKYPLIDIVAVMSHDNSTSNIENEVFDLQNIDTRFMVSTVDFRFSFLVDRTQLTVVLDYRPSLDDEIDMQRLLANFDTILQKITNDNQINLKEFSATNSGGYTV